MEESLPLLNRLTGARIRHEINLILAEPKASEMLARLWELGILSTIHPALSWDEALQDRFDRLDEEKIDPVWELPEHFGSLSLRQTLGYLVWLGELSEVTLRSIVSRLRCKSELKKLLVGVSTVLQQLSNLHAASPSQVVRALEKIPRAALYAAYLIITDEDLRSLIRKYVTKWGAVEPTITGDDLRKIGLSPSPAYGRILSALRDAWLDDEITSPDQEQALLEQLLAAEEEASA
jgi:tRNA nucleotidyltransferase (CCA-adding enzyme)